MGLRQFFMEKTVMNEQTVPCKGCGSCTLACTMGLDIPFLMKAYNQQKSNGSLPGGLYATLAKNPKMCIQCAHCAELCPQELDIPGLIRYLSVL